MTFIEIPLHAEFKSLAGVEAGTGGTNEYEGNGFAIIDLGIAPANWFNFYSIV